MTNFNPLPSHEGRLYQVHSRREHPGISIHSPHTRGDQIGHGAASVASYFNPLPSHEGRPADYAARELFTSDFNPLPSHEGRPGLATILQPERNFNPLPSHEGRLIARHRAGREIYFNPLPSHEGRPERSAGMNTPVYFNPLPSHEGRRDGEPDVWRTRRFQSTPLTRGETGL